MDEILVAVVGAGELPRDNNDGYCGGLQFCVTFK